MDNTVKVVLTTAIKVGGEELKELVFKELQAGGLRKIKGDIAHDMLDMVAQFVTHSAGIPPSSVDQISGKDFMQQIMPVFAGFFGDGQETGSTSAQS